jgi:hypothetical protein
MDKEQFADLKKLTERLTADVLNRDIDPYYAQAVATTVIAQVLVDIAETLHFGEVSVDTGA